MYTRNSSVPRHRNDAYYTEYSLTDILVNRFPEIKGNKNILEPCAGTLQIARRLADYGCRIYTNDIDRSHACNSYADARSPLASCWHPYLGQINDESCVVFPAGYPDWVITNPPFLHATPILDNALRYARVGVAFLLRITYAEPVRSRRDLLQRYADQMVWFAPVSPRPKFREGNGSDSATVAWFVWLKNWSWADRGLENPFGFITDWQS